MGAREDAARRRIATDAAEASRAEAELSKHVTTRFKRNSGPLLRNIEIEHQRILDIVNDPEFDWSIGDLVMVQTPSPKWWSKRRYAEQEFTTLTLGLLESWKSGWEYNAEVHLIIRSDGVLAAYNKYAVETCITFQQWCGYDSERIYATYPGITVGRLKQVLKVLACYEAPLL